MPLINFSGLASGIDSNALIDSVSEATRTQRVKPNEKKITELEETNAAYEQLKEKLTELQTKSLLFASINGGAVSKNATSTDETKVTGSASNAATNGSYDINVLSRAKNHTYLFDDRFGASTDVLVPLMNDGDPAIDRTASFVIGTGGDQVTIDVVMTSTMTVEGFVTAFNNATTNTGQATASVVNVGTSASPSYAIMINTNNEGTAKGQITSATINASITGQGRFLTASENPATDATFEVSGIAGTITRPTNKVTDVITGLTLNLVALGSSTITVSEDVATTTSKVQDFVDTYNDLVKFINENNLIQREEDGENVENIFSPLAKTRTDDNALTSLRNAIAAATHQNGDTVKIFANLGITTERDGTLKFKTEDFEAAVAGEPSSVNEVLSNFADAVALTGGVIHQFIAPNLLIDIASNSNKSLITNLNDRIALAEASILKTEESMRLRFARLESLFGRLQSQQSALTSALAGLA